MFLDLAAFFRYNFRAFFRTKGEQYRLTPRRFLVLFIWLSLYIPAQLINRVFFLLDDLFFPAYRKQVIQKPVFIIGNPRSGTTFLHRLMNKDKDHFTAFSVWELILAPSITQRKLIWLFVSISKAIGYPIKRITDRFEDKITMNKSAHKVRLDDAEEDEHILIHAWCTASLWPIYPYKDEILPYFFFDRDIPYPKRCKVMNFYRSMIQRHLFAHGGNRILLSKNPAQSAKLSSLLEYFPDARFIDIARNPIDALPSMMDYMETGWKIFCDPISAYPYKKEFFDVLSFYYLYPIEFFQDKQGLCNFIKYEDLVKETDEIIEDIYVWLGLKMSSSFQSIILKEMHQARQFNSKHYYSIESMGLSEPQIFSAFREVIDYYEFQAPETELPDKTMLWQLKNWRRDWKTMKQKRKARSRERSLTRRKAVREKKAHGSIGTPGSHPI